MYEDSKREIVMQISISPENFAPHSLVCLARHLRETYSDRSKANITVYDDEVAAETDTPLTIEADFKDYERAQHCHAVYGFDRSAKTEELTLEPNILRWRELSTKLDLSTKATPSCKLHIDDRCLLAFHDIDYPWEAWRKKNSGTVVLSATIEPDGTLARVQVVDSESNNPTSRAELMEAAVDNLRSWRFEAKGDSDVIIITYAFVMIDSSSENLNYKTDLRFSLPDRVIIRANPRP